MVADPGPGQGALQEMAESGDVDGAGLGRRPTTVVVVMVDTVHQPALDLPPVRLPLAIQRVLPAGCNIGGTIKRWCRFTQKKMMSGRYWSYGGAGGSGGGRSGADKVVLVRGGSGSGGSARANYIGRGRE